MSWASVPHPPPLIIYVFGGVSKFLEHKVIGTPRKVGWQWTNTSKIQMHTHKPGKQKISKKLLLTKQNKINRISITRKFTENIISINIVFCDKKLLILMVHTFGFRNMNLLILRWEINDKCVVAVWFYGVWHFQLAKFTLKK